MMQVAFIGSGLGLLYGNLRMQTLLFWLTILTVSAVITLIAGKINRG